MPCGLHAEAAAATEEVELFEASSEGVVLDAAAAAAAWRKKETMAAVESEADDVGGFSEGLELEKWCGLKGTNVFTGDDGLVAWGCGGGGGWELSPQDDTTSIVSD